MNRNYFRYLVRERKLVLIFFFVLYLAISTTPFILQRGPSGMRGSLIAAFVMSFCLTYALPVISFAFIHRRRSADLYLALPLSRKEQLLTILAFCILVPFVYFACAAILALLLSQVWAWTGKILLLIVYAGVIFAGMTLIHSALYLIGNNLFDGIVMIGVYTFLPVLIFLCLSIVISSVIAGADLGTYSSLPFFITSPAVMNMTAFTDTAAYFLGDTAYGPDMLYVIMPVLYALIAAFLLKIHFISRKSERAEQISDDILAYPLAIHICLFLCMLVISVTAVTDSLKSMIIWYLILLFIYIVSMFVYRRTLKVEPKTLLVYAALALLCLGFSKAAWETECFSLARNYTLNKKDALIYSYWASTSSDDLGVYTEQIDADAYKSVSFYLEIPTDRFEEYQEVIDVMESLRGRCIDAYYAKKDSAYSGNLNVFNGSINYSEDRQYYDTDNNYNYTLGNELLSEEDLSRISRCTNVEVSYYNGYEYLDVPLETYLKERK